jgi:hypothetical protein
MQTIQKAWYTPALVDLLGKRFGVIQGTACFDWNFLVVAKFFYGFLSNGAFVNVVFILFVKHTIVKIWVLARHNVATHIVDSASN